MRDWLMMNKQLTSFSVPPDSIENLERQIRKCEEIPRLLRENFGVG
jgi:hypothetical protein